MIMSNPCRVCDAECAREFCSEECYNTYNEVMEEAAGDSEFDYGGVPYHELGGEG